MVEMYIYHRYISIHVWFTLYPSHTFDIYHTYLYITYASPI